jgi:hypothetical protein
MDTQKQPPRSKKVSNRLIAVALSLVALTFYVAIALRLKYGSL